MRRNWENFFVMILIVASMLSVLGCGKSQIETDAVYKRGMTSCTCLYGDILFYKNAGEIKYQYITSTVEEGLPLYSDVLAEKDENPFANLSLVGPFMVIDEKATRENDGRPVLIMGYEVLKIGNGGKLEDVCRIASYNTATQKVKILYEIDESLQSMDLYGDYIYFTTNEGELGWNVHRIDITGKNYIKMENPEYWQFRVITVSGDRVYLFNGADQIYSVDLALEDMQYVRGGVCSGTMAGVVDDQLIYMAYGNQLRNEDGTIKMAFRDIWCSSLLDPSVDELWIPNVAGAIMYNNKLYYYVQTAEQIEQIAASETIDSELALQYRDILYEYSFDTGSTRKIYDVTGRNLNRVYVDFSDEYVICRETDKETGEYSLLAIDLTTGIETKIPY